MELLKLTSIQSPNADRVCEMITSYLSARLGIPAAFVNDIAWEERERWLDAGRIHVGWICGLPYVWKADQARPAIELLAAPVMRAARYQGRPVYFSDVVVRCDSRYYTFNDLRGASWAYNEPNSQSGYNITRYHLATLGHRSGYFRRAVQAGAHLAALEMVLDGRIDASAIDSTVLELELASRPELGKRLRIIASLGPSPIPPWVISKGVAPELREALRQELLCMHTHSEGQAILTAGQMACFARVEDGDYDPIRHMAQAAADVTL
jgi:phosphonate transport system substrate-binding protein